PRRHRLVDHNGVASRACFSRIESLRYQGRYGRVPWFVRNILRASLKDQITALIRGRILGRRLAFYRQQPLFAVQRTNDFHRTRGHAGIEESCSAGKKGRKPLLHLVAATIEWKNSQPCSAGRGDAVQGFTDLTEQNDVVVVPRPAPNRLLRIADRLG